MSDRQVLDAYRAGVTDTGAVALWVWCPDCERWHLHGCEGDCPDGFTTDRARHCAPNRRTGSGYVLRVVGDLTAEVRRAHRRRRRGARR